MISRDTVLFQDKVQAGFGAELGDARAKMCTGTVPPVNIVLLGPPGAGKGTQACYLSSTYDLVHISTGELLRRSVVAGTEAGMAAVAAMNAGRLVDDTIVRELLIEEMEALGSRGFLLDGYPRTLLQAIALDDLVEPLGRTIDLVLHFNVRRAALSGRIAERKREAEAEGTVVRGDDRQELLAKRFDEYDTWIPGILERYRVQGKLEEVDANLGIATLSAELAVVVDGLFDARWLPGRKRDRRR